MTGSLIVTADDFGQTAGINRGVFAAFERGIVTSASLMVRWPTAVEAAAYARAHPQLDLGLHLDFGEWVWVENEWRALYEVPGDPEAEIEWQLARFRELVGHDPSHLDSHQHAHLREPVRPYAVALADRLGVPLRGLSDAVRYRGDFYGQDGKGAPFPEAVTIEALLKLIAELPDGVTELGCHPGFASDEMSSMYNDERSNEVDVLCDPRVRAAIEEHGVILRTFSGLRRDGPTRNESHPPRGPLFKEIVYGDDSLSVGDVEFALDPEGGVTFDELDPGKFTLFKGRPFVESYSEFFAKTGLEPRRIFELGLWDGASLAFWATVFDPEKIVGIDLRSRGDSPHFVEWAAANGLRERVRTFWGVDQADRSRLQGIVRSELPGARIDLVIDDCSHLYAPTKASFEALFPLLRVGGFYVIEDWAWEYSGRHVHGEPADREQGERDMTDLVDLLVKVYATGNGLIRSIEIDAPFVAVERGPGTIYETESFALEDQVGRGPTVPDLVYTFERTLGAPPDAVFDAIVDPLRLERWWPGPAESADASLDVRPGGEYEITLHRDGDRFLTSGRYVEIERPQLVRQSFAFARAMEEDYIRAELTFDLQKADGGTRVSLTVSDVTIRDSVIPLWWAQSWEALLVRLARVVS